MRCSNCCSCSSGLIDELLLLVFCCSSSSSSSEEEENAKFKYCATVKFGDCNNDERRSSIAGSIIPLSVLPPVEAVLRLLEVRCGERLVIII